MAPLKWDVTGELPHITVGYIEDRQSEVADAIGHFACVSDGRIDPIEVSFCGSRGSCLGSIRTFEFGK